MITDDLRLEALNAAFKDQVSRLFGVYCAQRAFSSPVAARHDFEAAVTSAVMAYDDALSLNWAPKTQPDKCQPESSAAPGI